jgi:hypothetical protein
MAPAAPARKLRARAVWRVAVVAAAVAAILAPTPPQLVERFYSDAFYPALQGQLTSASNRVSFALIDVMAVALASGWLIAAVIDLRRRPAGTPGWLVVVGRLAARTAVGAAALYLAFLVLWGLNYRRVPLADKLQFERARVSPDGARELAARAITEANAEYEASAVRRTSEVSGSRPTSGDNVDARLADAFAAVERDLGTDHLAVPGRPKRTVLDLYFRRAAVDGMTDPYFLETLVARDLLPFERPIVVAHEWSHLAGYADESEANFVGWLTCVRAGGDLAYSGWLFIYGEVIGAIGAADRRQLPELAPGPRADRRAIAERLQRNVSPRLSAAGWIVYDRYLKANRVEAGAASYAEVVRLVLGTRFGSNWVPLRRAPPRT